MRRTRSLHAVLALSLLAAPAVIARPQSVHEDLTRQLRHAVSARTAAKQFETLAALRSLRDERLRSLFADLATGPSIELRGQGILGLAELSADGKLNLGMVGELKDPREQGLIILQALVGKMLDAEQVKSILGWPKLDPRLEVALRSYLAGLDPKQPIDTDRVGQLAKSDDSSVAILAGTLLLQSGDTGAGDAAATKLLALEPARRSAIGSQVLEMVRRDNLTNTTPLLKKLLGAWHEAGDPGDDVLLTMLRISPEAGSAELKTAWSNATDLAPKLRLGLIALSSAAKVDPAVLDTMAADPDKLVSTMGRAGLAIRNNKDVPPALLELVKQMHAPTTGWVISSAHDLSPENERTLLLSIIDWTATSREADDPVSKAAYECAWRLADRDPAALKPVFAAACDRKDAHLAEALLAGLLRSGIKPAWDTQLQWPGRTAQAMALLYEARLAGLNEKWDPAKPGPIASGGGFPNDPEKADQLRHIALGWGNLPEVYRTVAAWLALCQDGKEREALTRLLAPDAGS